MDLLTTLSAYALSAALGAAALVTFGYWMWRDSASDANGFRPRQDEAPTKSPPAARPRAHANSLIAERARAGRAVSV